VAQEHRIAFVLIFRCAEQFYVPNMQEQSKRDKKSTDKNSSFDGLIQEEIDLSNIYLAVPKLVFCRILKKISSSAGKGCNYSKSKFNVSEFWLFRSQKLDPAPASYSWIQGYKNLKINFLDDFISKI
jgi:hypothetical protein